MHLAMPWANGFDAGQTIQLPFRRQRATPVEASFMQDTRHISYARKGQLHAIQIPYREGAFVLTLVVPQADQPPEMMAGLLRRGGLGSTLAGLTFADTLVDIAIPRVTLTHSADLVPLLRNSALSPIFAPDADFRGVTGHPVKITTIRQQVFLQWDEAGTEAAAATGVIGTRAISDRPRFVADRPFLAFLSHMPTRLQIFSAFIVMPTGDP
jgi:serpin B